MNDKIEVIELDAARDRSDVPFPDADYPLHPKVRHTFASAAEVIDWGIPEALLRHRDFVRTQWAEATAPRSRS